MGANNYKGQIHHGEGGMPAPMGASVSKTNHVRGKVEFSTSPRAVDRATGKASSGRTPSAKRGSSRGD